MSVLATMRAFAETVTGLAFNDDGTASGSGAVTADEETGVDADVGYHFGFYSRPPDGGTGVVIKLGGLKRLSVLVAFRHQQYEMTLQKGEAGMQNAFGVAVLLDRLGKLRLGSTTATEPLVKGTEYQTMLVAAAAQLNAAGTDPVLMALCSTAAAGLTGAATAITGQVAGTLSQVSMTA